MKYPVGIQTFSEIREEGYVYIDKTGLIHKLVNDYKYVFLSRPRRFGKSLLLSTLQSYFEGKEPLFTGLAIEKLEKVWGSHPVFRFDLSPENFVDTDHLTEVISRYLRRYEELYGLNSEGTIAGRFSDLIRKAAIETGRKVVVLIDEYDKPLLDSLHRDELHENIKNELRAFYGVLKESDEFIRFGLVTGVTKFGKVNIFSGLNNLEDISLEPSYNTICGISESEFRNSFGESIKEFSTVRRITQEEAWSLFKTNYDGYLFAEYGEGIYNPFCVFKAFKRNKINNYWYETGSPSHLIDILEHNHFNLSSLNRPVRTGYQLSSLGPLNRDLIPLLYQAGYLTIKGYQEVNDRYLLGIPNLEVYNSFWNSLINHIFPTDSQPETFAIENFRESLLTGDINSFLIRTRSLMADTNSEQEPDKEIHFQNMFAIFIKLLGYVAHAESHTSRGRCDLTVMTPDYIYIFEFKVDSSPEEALSQIEERGYSERFEADTRTKILAGVNFSTEKRTIGEWVTKHVK